MPYADPEKNKAVIEAWRRAHPEKIAAYRVKRLAKPGNLERERIRCREAQWRELGLIFFEMDYSRLLLQQVGRCSLCRCLESESRGGRLFVDHDHTTMAIRGLLCDNCNTGLGHFKDSAHLLDRAQDYVQGVPFLESDKPDFDFVEVCKRGNQS